MEKKKGYGFDIKPDPSVNGYKMTLMAAPQQQITVKKAGDAVRAEAVIDGRQAVLEKMYIKASDGLTGPKVEYIMLYGKDLKTGEKRSQKIVPKSASKRFLSFSEWVLPHQVTRNAAATWELGKAAPGFSPLA